MSARELAAAGITDHRLRESYAACRALNSRHGRTYYLATLLLPAWKRPYVHALYGFARYADEIVDDLASTLNPQEKADRLNSWGDRFLADLRTGTSHPASDQASDQASDPVSRAVIDTARRWNIPSEHFDAFLAAMRMDLTLTSYATYDDLLGYMHGSAAVIGMQMVPVLEHPAVPREVVEPYARDLGVAFQLANVIRDVGDDLRRGRVYLPAEDLAAFGVTREQLMDGVMDARFRGLLRFEIARCRQVFRAAEPGIALLHPTSQDCMRTAYRLYGGILDAVERIDLQVLVRRAKVSQPRRLAVAVPAFARAYAARRRG